MSKSAKLGRGKSKRDASTEPRQRTAKRRPRRLKRLEFKPGEPLPRPNFPKIRTADQVYVPVLKEIRRACKKLNRRTGVAVGTDLIIKTLEHGLTELLAASRLTPRVLRQDGGAEIQFRDWLSRAASWGGGIDPLARWTAQRDSFERAGSSRQLPFTDVFQSLYAAAAFIARDARDFETLAGGVNGLVLRTEWTESLCVGAHNALSSGEFDDLSARLALFERMRFRHLPELTSLPMGEFDWEPMFDLLLDLPRGEIPAEFRPPIDPYFVDRSICLDLYRGIAAEVVMIHRAVFYPIPASSPYIYADGIAAVTPNRACLGDEVVVTGTGFGQPSDRLHLVLVSEIPAYGKECRIVNTTLWRDTEIRFYCPDWARSGPVGFLDEQALEDWQAGATFVGDALGSDPVDPPWWTERGKMREDARRACGSRLPSEFLTNPIPVFPCPADIGTNWFWGTVPEITFATGTDDHIVVEPGDTLTIDWEVINADTIRISRVNGPPYAENPLASLQTGGSFAITFDTDEDIDAVYQITATNPCGTVTRDFNVHVRLPTTVAIGGIEMTQSVQTFSLNDPEGSQVIPLFAGKRGVVRVYCDSGLPETYNQNGLLRDLKATLRIVPLSGQAALPGYPWSVPLDARPFSNLDIIIPRIESINRELPHQTINFLYPEDAAEGRVRLEVTLEPTDAWASWSAVNASMEVEFRSTPGLDLRIFRVHDDHRAGRVATADEVEQSLNKLRNVLPVSHADGLRIHPVPGSDVIFTDFDYDDLGAWHSYFGDDIMDRLDDAAEEIGDESSIYCAVIPENAVTASPDALGVGWPGGQFDVWFVSAGSGFAVAAWIAELGGNTEGQEVGHALGLRHNNHDTQCVGMDLRRWPDYTTVPADAPGLMHEAGSGWISPAEYVFFAGFNAVDILALAAQAGMSGTVIKTFSVNIDINL